VQKEGEEVLRAPEQSFSPEPVVKAMVRQAGPLQPWRPMVEQVDVQRTAPHEEDPHWGSLWQAAPRG